MRGQNTMAHITTNEHLQEQIFADKVRRARETPIVEKILEGPRLFDMNAEIIKGAIRSQFPGSSEEQMNHEYFRRLQIARTIDDAGMFRDVGMIDE